MVLRGGDRPAGEDAADLQTWLLGLTGGPTVHQTALLACGQHDDSEPLWHYVEADSSEGVARRRCLACAHVVYALDSDDRWTHPAMWACDGCGHSIVEVAAGLSSSDGEHVQWVVLGVRCIECGRLAGITDLVLDDVPLDQVMARI